MYNLIIVLLSALLFINGCSGGGGGGGNVNQSSPVVLPDSNATHSADSYTDGNGSIYSQDSGLKSIGVSAIPPMYISAEDPAPNSPVTITIAGLVGSSIDVTATGSGCGSIQNTTGISPLNIAGNSGSSGYCDIKATYSDGKIMSGRFVVAASEPDIPPVSSSDGTWIIGEKPQASTTLDSDAKRSVGLPAISKIDGPKEFINGGSSEFTVYSSSGSNIAAILVQVESYDGYYSIPVYSSGKSGQFKLAFAPDLFTKLRALRAAVDLNLNITVIDDLNQVSQAFNMPLHANETGFGDVKVSISWDTATDVDLHVTDPNGVTTYYGNKTPENGSSLDLDSNPGCSIDGINNENIFWSNAAAIPGKYTVTVNMYDDCTDNGSGGASGTVTMIYNGEDAPQVVSWSLGSSGSKTFTFTHGGSKAKVSGKVSYEDFPVTRTGLGSSRMLPVRFAEVQVVRNFDNEILATGSTDASGKYEITFQNNDTEHPGYYVLVYARQNSATLKQEVRDFARKVYSFKSGSVIDEIQTPQKSDMDIAIEKSKNAGAMNIFDVGVSCSDYARLHGGKVPEKLTFFWQVNGISGSYFSPVNKEIVLLGEASDPDEYDDLVIGHEYGHFVMSTYSKDNSPGGDHSLAPSVPTLAWSEGWATYFSAAALNKSYYLDTTGTGVGSYYSLETLPSDITLGNTGNKLEGSVSEAVVTSVLWDLYDGSNETFDTLSGKSTAIWKILTTYLNGTNFKNRGYAGIDLVDFLDGWFCLGYGEKGADEIGMIGNIWFMHDMSYDFKELDSCK